MTRGREAAAAQLVPSLTKTSRQRPGPALVGCHSEVLLNAAAILSLSLSSVILITATDDYLWSAASAQMSASSNYSAGDNQSSQ